MEKASPAGPAGLHLLPPSSFGDSDRWQVEDMNTEAMSLIKAIQANPDPDATWPDTVASCCIMLHHVASCFIVVAFWILMAYMVSWLGHRDMVGTWDMIGRRRLASVPRAAPRCRGQTFCSAATRRSSATWPGAAPFERHQRRVAQRLPLSIVGAPQL